MTKASILFSCCTVSRPARRHAPAIWRFLALVVVILCQWLFSARHPAWRWVDIFLPGMARFGRAMSRQ